ncbi:hypothetical protein L1987_31948 [Smallanthus sonchifolius]|uniref:Uncharacterized protein n=1 Tax=Smallanthus sonchifolius TaxID=185202 RepID=A0ACB9I8I3_9ASTR|nr:hypothetical protein L1987_31948 [Smallanthus sonchifolius]
MEPLPGNLRPLMAKIPPTLKIPSTTIATTITFHRCYYSPSTACNTRNTISTPTGILLLKPSSAPREHPPTHNHFQLHREHPSYKHFISFESSALVPQYAGSISRRLRVTKEGCWNPNLAIISTDQRLSRFCSLIIPKPKITCKLQNQVSAW